MSPLSPRARRGAAALVLALSASAFAVLPASSVAASPVPTHGAECESSARPQPGHQHEHDRNDVTKAQADAAERQLRSRLAGKVRPLQVTIPVVFHVVYANNGTGNVSNSAINAQIAEMNQNFAGGESSAAADTEFTFTLQAIRRHQNNTWFNNSDSAAGEAAMKTPTHEGDAGTLNIWSTNTDYLGFATFPWWYAGDPELDGIVIQWGSLPGGPIANFNLGKTASHEAGHWLGLYHTFEGGCSTTNDEVGDTPAMSEPTSGCPSGKNTCPAAGLDPIRNYMDYSYDSCYNQFTPGQSTRMQDAWTAFRA